VSAPDRLTVAFATAGALLCAIAAILGAVGSHLVAATLDPAGLASWNTAVSFQFWHGLGLLAVAWTCDRRPASNVAIAAGVLLLAGTLLFSGSIYLARLGITASSGPAAPLGGTALIAGWFALALAWVLARRGPGDA
jgi:uncharacterized membrane protein YgdD (TMEM256/DUF423 family)